MDIVYCSLLEAATELDVKSERNKAAEAIRKINDELREFEDDQWDRSVRRDGCSGVLMSQARLEVERAWQQSRARLLDTQHSCCLESCHEPVSLLLLALNDRIINHLLPKRVFLSSVMWYYHLKAVVDMLQKTSDEHASYLKADNLKSILRHSWIEITKWLTLPTIGKRTLHSLPSLHSIWSVPTDLITWREGVFVKLNLPEFLEPLESVIFRNELSALLDVKDAVPKAIELGLRRGKFQELASFLVARRWEFRTGRDAVKGERWKRVANDSAEEGYPLSALLMYDAMHKYNTKIFFHDDSPALDYNRETGLGRREYPYRSMLHHICRPRLKIPLPALTEEDRIPSLMELCVWAIVDKLPKEPESEALFHDKLFTLERTLHKSDLLEHFVIPVGIVLMERARPYWGFLHNILSEIASDATALQRIRISLSCSMISVSPSCVIVEDEDTEEFLLAIVEEASKMSKVKFCRKLLPPMLQDADSKKVALFSREFWDQLQTLVKLPTTEYWEYLVSFVPYTAGQYFATDVVHNIAEKWPQWGQFIQYMPEREKAQAVHMLVNDLLSREHSVYEFRGICQILASTEKPINPNSLVEILLLFAENDNLWLRENFKPEELFMSQLHLQRLSVKIYRCFVENCRIQNLTVPFQVEDCFHAVRHWPDDSLAACDLFVNMLLVGAFPSDSRVLNQFYSDFGTSPKSIMHIGQGIQNTVLPQASIEMLKPVMAAYGRFCAEDSRTRRPRAGARLSEFETTIDVLRQQTHGNLLQYLRPYPGLYVLFITPLLEEGFEYMSADPRVIGEGDEVFQIIKHLGEDQAAELLKPYFLRYSQLEIWSRAEMTQSFLQKMGGGMKVQPKRKGRASLTGAKKKKLDSESDPDWNSS